MSRRETKRFAAKLLFQFRVVVDGEASKRRLCEERIVLFKAASAGRALAAAKRKGRSAEYDYANDEGNPVHFEFIGVVDLLCLDPVCEADEVWFDVRTVLTPMERKHQILPTDNELLLSAR